MYGLGRAVCGTRFTVEGLGLAFASEASPAVWCSESRFVSLENLNFPSVYISTKIRNNREIRGFGSLCSDGTLRG